MLGHLLDAKKDEPSVRTPTLLDVHEAEDGARSYWLVGLEGTVRLPINAPILVGRGPYNHVVLDDARVSWQHARIAPQAGGLVIHDLNSRNGTMVNGTVVTRQQLHANDIVCFGARAFRIERIAQERPPSASPAAPFDPEGATIGAMPAFDEFADTSPPFDLPAGTSTADVPIVDLNKLEDAYKNLGTLYSFMQAISKTIDRRELLALIGTKTREVYPSSSVGAYLRAQDGSFVLSHWASAGGGGAEDVLPDEIRERVTSTHRALLTPGGMYAPMIDRDEVLGVIHVASERGGFTPADLDLLTGMAAPAAIMLQNTRMHEESLLRDRLKYDLELAEEIQRSFLPREVISVDGIELFAEYRAAYGVGGDFYDVFWVGPDRLGIFIGDIAGKGVSAALIMARTSTELRAAALSLVEPALVLTAMNKAVIARNQPELFFTGIYLTLDVRTGAVLLASAGHPAPYVRRADGRVETITEGAASAVGILDDAAFTATELQLGFGDTLVLYTDGVIEAPDAHGELYGAARLEACLVAAGKRPADIAARILRSVDEHARDVVGRDDLTLLICQTSLKPKPRRGK
jgi:serine phosphatase RsbU (regulator of sigma subunit)